MKPFESPIYVTRPFLPPIDHFSKGLGEIWDNAWLTNDGPLLRRFEIELLNYLNAQNICLFSNGTLALQIALQGMGITGEVITTPFTFVATTHALFWNKIRPVFCDIEEEYFTMDPDKVEELITPLTTAILAVHVFGYPCRLEKLREIAKRHNIALIYDAAHAFGVRVNGSHIVDYGDMSMLSFHATKIFHTFEGGALIFRDSALLQTFNYLKNFGFKNEVEVVMPGTNAKMSEVHALMGSQLLGYMDKFIEKGRKIEQIYRESLSDVPGITFCKPVQNNIRHNHSYVPIQVEANEFGKSRDQLFDQLKTYNVFTRRYFFPLVCDYACYRHLTLRDPLPNARNISEKILTLPSYYDLDLNDVCKICDIVKHIYKN